MYIIYLPIPFLSLCVADNKHGMIFNFPFPPTHPKFLFFGAFAPFFPFVSLTSSLAVSF